MNKTTHEFSDYGITVTCDTCEYNAEDIKTALKVNGQIIHGEDCPCYKEDTLVHCIRYGWCPPQHKHLPCALYSADPNRCVR